MNVKLNTAQKIVLSFSAIALVGVLAFPPFHNATYRNQEFVGFALIFAPPHKQAVAIDSLLLLVEVLATLLLTVIGFLLTQSYISKDELSGNGRFDLFLESNLFKNLKVVCWVVYALPLVFGRFGYDWQPHEYYDPDRDILVDSHEVDDGNGRSGTYPDAWKDKVTGVVYDREMFASHSKSEQLKVPMRIFLYGILGCFLYALFQKLGKLQDIRPAFWQAFCWNTGIAIFLFIFWH